MMILIKNNNNITCRTNTTANNEMNKQTFIKKSC